MEFSAYKGGGTNLKLEIEIICERSKQKMQLLHAELSL